jgi:AcrR family transcriptional regulator
MATPDLEDTAVRARQRRRTRAAIVAAAAGLLRAGGTPSVGQVADAADVSRRTVYQYFPTLEHLLIDATLGLLDQTAVDEAIEDADPAEDAEARVTALVRALGAHSADQMPLGRQLVRLTVDQPPAGSPGAPRRGYRRVAWIERALEPARPRLAPAAFERLVSALALVIGWEAVIVLTDVRGLDTDAQLDAQLWAARALIRAALADTARSASGRTGSA